MQSFLKFDLWYESFIFAAIFSVIILIPCVLIAMMGKSLINKLGRYPSNTPVLQMGVAIQFCVIVIFTFAALIGFYQFFAN